MATGEAGSFVASSLRLFERTNSDIEVNLHIKKPSGKGGVMDFLRTAKEVAPSVMPDVVVMNATDLNQAYADNLVQPLDGRLDRSIVQDLLPASRRIGTVDDRLVGVPLGIEIEHTVYNTLTFTDTPMLWSDVLSKNTIYLFPAKGVNGLVNDVTLSQYFSAGGSLVDAEGMPTIDDGVLRDVFGFYEQARELGIIDSSILEAAASEDLWPVYLEGRAGLAQISVRQYLMDRDLLNSTSFAPLPIQDREKTPVTMMHGWVLVLVTSDVGRQDAALRLMESFLATGNNAAWNRINKSIPSRDTAYQQLAGDDPYWEFLTEQLNSARPEPRFSGYDRIGRIIQQTLEQVIRGEATAEEAAATAIDALAQ
jgi:ABC-type glycerol-3-phosphate transport system substrate-binding protein